MGFVLFVAIGMLIIAFFQPDFESALRQVEADKATLVEHEIVSQKWWYRAGMTYESIKAELGL